jgi:hypothetical protein
MHRNAASQRLERNAIKIALGLAPGDRLPNQYRLKKHPSGYGRYTRLHFYRAYSEVEDAFKEKTHSAFGRWLRNQKSAVSDTTTPSFERITYAQAQVIPIKKAG